MLLYNVNEEDEFMSTIELAKKIEKLSSEDYDFVISLIDYQIIPKQKDLEL